MNVLLRIDETKKRMRLQLQQQQLLLPEAATAKTLIGKCCDDNGDESMGAVEECGRPKRWEDSVLCILFHMGNSVNSSCAMAASMLCGTS